MNLIDELEARLAKEESMFRAQLLREDVARLRHLKELASEHVNRDDFRKAGAYIGWTSGDMRTHELMDELTVLLDAMYDWRNGGGVEAEKTLRAAWDEFHVQRMRKLLHCL